jgi:hypothetical protein
MKPSYCDVKIQFNLITDPVHFISFVKFSNVRDVTKLTKALNAVWFGQFRVRASVARFDRYSTEGGRRPEAMQAALSQGAVITKGGPQTFPGQATRITGDPSNKPMPESGRDGVLMGDIVLNLGNRDKPLDQGEGQQQPPTRSDVPAVVVNESESSIFMRNYRSKSDDVQWAKNGLVATVINGEAIHVVQNRITDAGFNDLVVTPMGADKVFICRPEGGMLWLLLEAQRSSLNSSSQAGHAGTRMGDLINGARGFACTVFRCLHGMWTSSNFVFLTAVRLFVQIVALRVRIDWISLRF